MIRRKPTIDHDIKMLKANIDAAVTISIENEERDNNFVATLQKKLSKLTSEACFEDTLEGKISKLEQTSFDQIKIILKELSDATGKSYFLPFESENRPRGRAFTENRVLLKAPFPAASRERTLERGRTI